MMTLLIVWTPQLVLLCQWMCFPWCLSHMQLMLVPLLKRLGLDV